MNIRNILKESIEELIREEFKNNDNYTHFAINKETKKIVNGWDYKGYDQDELRQYKNDYFFNDLMDNNMYPKKYTIWTLRTLKSKGIDPDDNSNWANE